MIRCHAKRCSAHTLDLQQPPFQKYKRERDRANIAGLGSSGEPLAGDTVGTHSCGSTRSILARHTDATSRDSAMAPGALENLPAPHAVQTSLL